MRWFSSAHWLRIAVLALGIRVSLAHGDSASFADSSLGDDSLWQAGFHPPGVTGPIGNYGGGDVTTAIVHEGDFIIAGSFSFVDGTPAHDLARWDGSRWWSFDSHPPFLGGIQRLAIWNGDLIASGTVRDQDSTSCVWRWDGTIWRPLGTSTLASSGTSTVYSLASYNGDLIAGGSFDEIDGAPAPGVARWDGTRWHPMGSAFGGTIVALAVHQGVLYAGGNIINGADSLSGNIMHWNGSEWEITGGGVDDYVVSLVSHGNKLVVGGRMTRAGSKPVTGIAAWDGTSWAAFGAPLRRSNGSTVMAHLLQPHQNMLFVAGSFDSAGTIACDNIVTWNGAGWEALPVVRHESSDPYVRAFVEYGEQLVAVGSFGEDDFAAWDGSRWRPFPSRDVRLAGRSSAMLSSSEGLFCAATFEPADSFEAVHAVGRWDGTRWEIVTPAVDGVILALTKFRDEIIAAGDFETAGSDVLSHIAAWDGSRWRRLGGGTNGPVTSLTIYRDRLIAAGDFRMAGGRFASNIATWDGKYWTELGTGISAWGVLDLEVYGGNLLACGQLAYVNGEPARGIVLWDGATWRPIDSRLDYGDGWIPYLNQMVVWDGRLVVGGGLLSSVNGVPSGSLAIWDGATWSPLVPSFDGFVNHLDTHGGHLLVGGDFEDSSYLFRHDGTRWLRLGQGLWSGTPGHTMSPGVTASATWNGDLYFSGSFAVAGDKPASSFARWRAGAFERPPRRVELSFGPNPARLETNIHWFQADPGFVRVIVYDALGRLVSTVSEGFETGGTRRRPWSMRGADGRPLASGVYFVRLESQSESATRKLVIVR